MQLITGSVGESATNIASDVALVQAILLKTMAPASSGKPSKPYLMTYDGVCGKDTKSAIRAFQTDHVFVSAALKQSVPNPNATAGQVKPLDATWTQLLAKVSVDFANLRVLAGGKTVYVQASSGDLLNRLAAVAAMTFAPEFRIKVRGCLSRMYQLHGIAVGVCPQGDRRTFQAQYALWLQGPGITNAGPGESNHNFGMATDIGFGGLRWLHANGTVDANETPWLHHLTAKDAAQALVFWEALRTAGTNGAVGAFRGPLSDRPHLQNWSDANVSMGGRLAALLQTSGTMRWAFVHPRYRTDFGLGGAMYEVGTAAQIWNLDATVTPATLTQARTAAAVAHGTPPPPAATALDVTAMRQSLRNQFELADANWQSWTPQ